MGDAEDKDAVDRRSLLALGAVIGTTGSAFALRPGAKDAGATITNALPWHDGQTDAPEAAPGGDGWRFLTDAEAAFLTAIVDRLIPPDQTGPSASQAGVVVFLDRQLAGAYGQGAHFYLGGPWGKGTESQGYQSRFAPAQFYRHAIAAIEQAVSGTHGGKGFHELDPKAQDGLVAQMESGALQLSGPITSKDFFTQLLQNVQEGYFSDPIYGGNRSGSAWAMIGFPGAHYDYSRWVTAHNQRVPVQPVGLRGRADWLRS